MLSKSLFVECIENIHHQIVYDIEHWSLIKEAFKVNEFHLYDNTRLINAVMSLLRQYFPPESNGFCEIEHYCFVLDFGKLGNGEYQSPEDLYDELVKQNSPKSDGRRYKVGEDKSFH